MNEQEFSELSAAAAVNALSPVDERRFRAARAAHPEWSATVQADAETAAALAASVAPVAPPVDLRASLLAQIAATPQTRGPADAVPPAPVDDPLDASDPFETPDQLAAPAATPTGSTSTIPAPRRPLRLMFALAASVALLLGIGVGAVALGQYLNRPAAVVALEQIEGSADAQQASVELDAGGSATAHWSADLGSAVLVTDGIAEPADGETYELWFVRGDQAVSAGTFAVDGGNATAQLLGAMHAGDVIAVTVEQSGGSPTGIPTSDPVIVIPTA